MQVNDDCPGPSQHMPHQCGCVLWGLLAGRAVWQGRKQARMVGRPERVGWWAWCDGWQSGMAGKAGLLARWSGGNGFLEQNMNFSQRKGYHRILEGLHRIFYFTTFTLEKCILT